MSNNLVSNKMKPAVKAFRLKTNVKAGGSLGDVVDEIVKDPAPIKNGGVGDIVD